MGWLHALPVTQKHGLLEAKAELLVCKNAGENWRHGLRRSYALLVLHRVLGRASAAAVAAVCVQKELRLKEKERLLVAERAALLERQAVQQARDAALKTLQLKYHLCAQKIKE
jgi:hypothetical protein